MEGRFTSHRRTDPKESAQTHLDELCITLPPCRGSVHHVDDRRRPRRYDHGAGIRARALRDAITEALARLGADDLGASFDAYVRRFGARPSNPRD